MQTVAFLLKMWKKNQMHFSKLFLLIVMKINSGKLSVLTRIQY